MVIDRDWMKRNVGNDPISSPASTLDFAAAIEPGFNAVGIKKP